MVRIEEAVPEGLEATMNPDLLSVRTKVETFPVKENSRNSKEKCLMCKALDCGKTWKFCSKKVYPHAKE